MFSESFDIKQNDKLKELDEKIIEEDVDDEIDGKDKKEGENNMIEKTNAQINDWIRFLRNDDPNDLNNQEKEYTLKTALSESFEAGIWQIDEEKIIWFEKELPDGRKVKISGWDNIFSLNISKEHEGWWLEELTIDLSNFKHSENNKSNDWHTQNNTNVLPEMVVNGNIRLLDSSIQNADDVIQIVNSIEKNIMRPERENVHGIQDKQERQNKEIREKKQDNYKLLLFELDADMNSNPPRTNEMIAKYIMNSENFDAEWQYLSSRKSFLALCVLLRSCNNIQEIKDKVLEDNEVNIQKAANTKDKDAWENIIEYLKNNPADLWFFVNYEEDIVALALKSDNIIQEEKDFLLKH